MEEDSFLNFLFVLIWLSRVFIAQTVCGVMNVRVAVLYAGWSLQCISKGDLAVLNEAGRSVSVNGNEETHLRDLKSIDFT
jgi:hypothetical protein